MSTSASAKKVYPANYGLPPRPPTASTPLWENLLHPNKRAPTSLADIAPIAPPLGPLDKNATSMRILLHDTQSNFEKFGKHVGQLFDEIKEFKVEIKTVHSMFERDRESLMGDIIDLVNRSQKETQKSIGTPAQDQSVEGLFKDVNHRLSGLDQRLDALQSFNQTHTQALQTQIQAVQILLDKQATIIAAVLPLLPLLQAVPLHIDAVKATLNETLATFLSSHKTTHGPGTPVVVHDCSAIKLGKRKQIDIDKPPHTLSPTPSMATPSRKKARMDDLPGNSASKHVANSETANISSSPIRRAPLFALRSITTSAQDSSRRNENNIVSTLGISPVQIPDRNVLLSSRSRRRTFAIPALTTPRRPLGDLPVPSPRLTSSIHRSTSKLPPVAPEMSLERSSTLGPGFSIANLTGITPTTARPPRILHVHTSFANIDKNKTSHATAGSLADSKAYVPVPATATATASSSLDRQPSHVFGPPIAVGAQQPSLEVKRESLEDLRSLDTETAGPPTLASAGLEILSVKPKGVSGKARERRSPTREGRRFIPLVDSEDEEDAM